MRPTNHGLLSSPLLYSTLAPTSGRQRGSRICALPNYRLMSHQTLAKKAYQKIGILRQRLSRVYTHPVFTETLVYISSPTTKNTHYGQLHIFRESPTTTDRTLFHPVSHLHNACKHVQIDQRRTHTTRTQQSSEVARIRSRRTLSRAITYTA